MSIQLFRLAGIISIATILSASPLWASSTASTAADTVNLVQSGHGHGPGDGSGNGGNGPRDGSGNGSRWGDCLFPDAADADHDILLSGRGGGRGGNGGGGGGGGGGRGGNGGNGPGDGTGSGGSGPKDGSGNGRKSGTCINS